MATDKRLPVVLCKWCNFRGRARLECAVRAQHNAQVMGATANVKGERYKLYCPKCGQSVELAKRQG